METFTINLGGFSVALKIENGKIRNVLQKYFNNIISSKIGKIDFLVTVRFSRVKRSKARHDNIIFNKTKNAYQLIFPYFTSNIYLNDGFSHLYISADKSAMRVAIKNFLGALYVLLLYKTNAFLLHSSSFVYKNKAYIFSGPSGAGKSTMLTLLKEKVSILNDDITVIKLIRNIWVAQATPFSKLNKYLRNVKHSAIYPIGIIFKLRKAKEISIDSISLAEKLNFIITSSRTPSLPNSKQIISNVLRHAEILVKNVPCFELGFPNKKFSIKDILHLCNK